MTDEVQPPATTDQPVEAPAETPSAEATPTPSWYDGAPDETIGFIQNKGWESEPLKAIEAYQNLEKFHGVPAESIIKMPKDPTEEGAFDSIYDRLGRPETADKYEYTPPEGMKLDEARLNVFKDAAYKAGLNEEQVKALADVDFAYTGKAMEEYQAEQVKQQEIEINELKSEWGQNYEERAELGRRFVRNNLPAEVNKEEMLAKIEDAIGTSATLKLFANAGDKTSREAPIHDSGESRPFGYTREQATADRAALMVEISADQVRLDNYNHGRGSDIKKLEDYNKIIAG